MDDYANRSYGEIPVGFGAKPGIVVVDFQVEDWTQVEPGQGSVMDFVRLDGRR